MAIRCYLIDTPKKEIRSEVYDGTLEDIYKKLGFGCYEFAQIMLNGKRDTLIVDANALQTAQTNKELRNYLFSHKRYHSILIGRGLVIGHDEYGDEQDPHMSSEDLWREIKWES